MVRRGTVCLSSDFLLLHGSFDLYGDSGDTYDYQEGLHSVIPIRWDDKSGSLTIGARIGSFPGMVDKRQFDIVFVKENHGVGVGISTSFDREVTYEGTEAHVSAPGQHSR
jgi:alpha-D-xyloside xylohydrolase